MQLGYPVPAASFLPGPASGQMVPILHPTDQALLAAVNGSPAATPAGTPTSPGAASGSPGGASTPVSQHAAAAAALAHHQQAMAAVAAAAAHHANVGKQRSDKLEVRS